MKCDSRPKQKQNTTRYAILIKKTNRRNSHVARVPAYSYVKGAVRYIFGASILPNFLTVYLYVKKKRPFTKAQTQFTCFHTYIKCFLEAGVRFLLSVTKTRKTFVAGGEERRNGCIRMVRPWLNSFRFIDNWRSYTYHAVL